MQETGIHKDGMKEKSGSATYVITSADKKLLKGKGQKKSVKIKKS